MHFLVDELRIARITLGPHERLVIFINGTVIRDDSKSFWCVAIIEIESARKRVGPIILQAFSAERTYRCVEFAFPSPAY